MRFKLFEDFNAGSYWEISRDESREWTDSRKCDVMSAQEISSIISKFALDTSTEYIWLVSKSTDPTDSILRSISDVRYNISLPFESYSRLTQKPSEFSK